MFNRKPYPFKERVVNFYYRYYAKNLAVINRFREPATNGRLDLSLSWRVSEDSPKRPYCVWSGSRDPR